jgi:hypothetical protein
LHLILSYGYEITGGILIFVSSAVTEASMPEARRWRQWIIFGGIALIYIGLGLGTRYDDENQSARTEKN